MICDGCGKEAFGPCGDPTIPKGWFSKYYSYHDNVYGCSEECLTIAKEKRTVTKILINAGPSEAGWHRLQSVLKCPRYYVLERDRPWKWSPPLVKGSLVHIGLAHHYRRVQAEQQGEDPDQWYEPMEAIARLSFDNAADSPHWLEYAELAQEAVGKYIVEWEGEQWKVRAVEHELRAKVDGKYLYTQRVDAIFEAPGGKIWMVDHKTTFRIAPKTIRRYTLSGQMLGYQLFGQKLYGDKFAGVMLNMIQLPQEVGKNYSFARPTIEPAPFAVPKLKQTILHAEELIEKYKDKDPMDVPGVFHETACWTPYGQCPFASYCQWGS